METENEKKFLIIGVAALFRAASIAHGEDGQRLENMRAIKEATEFVNACESHGLLPEKAE